MQLVPFFFSLFIIITLITQPSIFIPTHVLLLHTHNLQLFPLSGFLYPLPFFYILQLKTPTIINIPSPKLSPSTQSPSIIEPETCIILLPHKSSWYIKIKTFLATASQMG
ncbi:hypothetical protein V8G54_036510 [Vigna mungo]|uniref:Uncharacterized protein n=1 Tax=Vigna mungo TaxID=3915 RepID=A0AAQ3MHE2_VIGMU